VKVGSVVSPYMVKMLVKLFCGKRKVSNASLEEFQFWTESSEEYLVD
jgi:hypothetical protein